MIQIKNLSKNFRTEEVETIALNGISMEVKKGEFIAIMGPSGCGKSTLLHILGLLDNPDEGSYLLEGEEVGHLKEKDRTRYRKGRIGFVFQSFNLIDELTVEENVDLQLKYLGIPKAERKQQVLDILRKVRLSQRAKHYPQQLSGGQQQRVAIARAIVMNPKYLFCDEPNSGLDPKTSLVIDELLSGITKEYGITTIINTHDMNSVMGIGENIVFIADGRKEWQGDKDSVISSRNKKLNDLVFASDLFKKVREVEREEK